MNERIKELAEQAAKPENRMNFVTYGKLTNEKLIEFAIQSGVHPSYLDPENPENSLTGSLNKFAEMIIQTCITLVDSTPIAYDDYRKQIEEEMRNDCRDRLKNHFGVEE